MILCDNCSTRLSCSVYRNGDTRTECEFYQPMTEQEYLQSYNTEQLAEWIVSEINERVKLALYDSELNDGDVDADFYMEDSDDWKEWLKQPHQKE